MSTARIEPSDFEAYFEALHGYPPYPWQRRLAERAVHGTWPQAIDLPTGSGKTASIDIAIFALACQASRDPALRKAPIRIFFCVNRRVIVDEACERARKIAAKLATAEQGGEASSVLGRVAAALRAIAGSDATSEAPPLDVLELRGGVYRDNRWARSMIQPTVVCTTIDQLGSRLLFRGYGISSNAAPIQAALIAYDSLVLLDEAHISRPFVQSLEAVRGYLNPLRWAERSIPSTPMCVVQMTATPSESAGGDLLTIEDDDRDPRLPLIDRLQASKPITLHQAKKGDVAKEMLSLVGSLDSERPISVGILVNRVVTAREIYKDILALQETSGKKRKLPVEARIELVIGSMRPVDREHQTKRLQQLVGPGRSDWREMSSFVVATQCLEVGADYDFDVMITECASLDALRQRFGRLNRGGRPIQARGFIVVSSKQVVPDAKLDDDKPVDPIYGNALSRTWNWLDCVGEAGETIDFGIDNFHSLLRKFGEDGRIPQNLLAPSASKAAPVMPPAYLDLWCQTAPRSVPDPDIGLFLHGEAKADVDVQVCWRAELTDDDDARKRWIDLITIFPPTAAECMSVPLSRVRRWMIDHQADPDDAGDAMGVAADDEHSPTDRRAANRAAQTVGVLWRGPEESTLLRQARDLKPGDTIILPVWLEHSELLGHVPSKANSAVGDDPLEMDHPYPSETRISDVAERAHFAARRRVAIRLHPALRHQWPKTDQISMLFDRARADQNSDDAEKPNWNGLLHDAIESLRALPDEKRDTTWSWILDHDLRSLRFREEAYPDGAGVVLTSRERVASRGSFGDRFGVAIDEGDDARSLTGGREPISLEKHTEHVVESAKRFIARLGMEAFAEPIEAAARLHDLGKADPRFQAMLRETSPGMAWLHAGVSQQLLAKSSHTLGGRKSDRERKKRAELPPGFRHEMLSVELSALSSELPSDGEARELVLHLIAAHHGHARPFAPVVPDDELPDVDAGMIRVTHEQRKSWIPPHRLDSGVSERFWRLTRRYGWWGLAYLESVIRLADQVASADEDKPVTKSESPSTQLATETAS